MHLHADQAVGRSIRRVIVDGMKPTLLGVAIACFAQAPKKGKPEVTKKDWGKTAAGQAVEMYTLTNAAGMRAEIITYGGALVSLTAPDRTGKWGDVVLGMDDMKGYETPVPYFGANTTFLSELK